MLAQVFERLKQGCPTTVATTITGQQVPPGQAWQLKFVGVYNDSAESFSISIGILRGNKLVPFSLTASLATKAAVTPWPLPTLGEGEYLQVIATGTTNGGDIYLYYNGVRHYLGAEN